MLRQRVVMTAQKAQADVLLHRLHYALPGWDAATERRDAQDELHSAAQARARADGDFDADRKAAASKRSPWHSPRIFSLKISFASLKNRTKAIADTADFCVPPPPKNKLNGRRTLICLSTGCCARRA